jgi:CheY-like chemotaxis protein
MARKRALIVDDSKSARVILSRMLEKYDIEVDMAESAEQAIEYLQHDRPDAIFMDHLMPGMDGLQAVRAIKSNPQTAMIPIMMYTSQAGELYVGQARALGAMGVLPKQVRPVDVSKVLYELHLLPDRRDMTEPALLPVELENGAPVERPALAVSGASAPEWACRLETLVKQQSVDLRRFVLASLDSFSGRMVADLRDTVPAAPAPVMESLPPPPRRPSQWRWVASLAVACLIAGTCAVLWVTSREDVVKSRGELAALRAANADLRRSRDELAASVKDLTAALAATPVIAAAPAGAGAGGPGAQAGLPRSEPFPYGELPFDRSRLEVLRDVLAKLETQGFHGVVKITSLAGIFCLSGNASEGFVPANSSLPASKCDLMGNPFEESLSGQQRQSIAFANLVAGVRQRTAGAITVVFDNAGTSHPLMPYPPRNDSLTAGEWNRAATANNRVEFAAEP